MGSVKVNFKQIGLLVVLFALSFAGMQSSSSQLDLEVFPPEAALHGNPSHEAAEQGAMPISAKWNKNPVTYSFENCPSSLDCETAHTAVREAMNTWQSVSGIVLVEVPAGGDISIKWAAGEAGYPYPFDGPGGRLAHGILPVDGIGEWAGDVHFDDDENWVTTLPTLPYPQQVYLPSVALHEIGHALGLEHSLDPGSIMWAYYVPGRGIGAADIIAIQSLYGPPAAAQ
jgi:predicted Zn-dependent protease